MATSKQTDPRFLGVQLHDGRHVIADSQGKLWRVCAHSATMRPVVVEKARKPSRKRK